MILRDGRLRVDEFPEPTPGPGLLLLRTLACGVCATDIHLQRHGQRLAEWSKQSGGVFRFDPQRDLVMGHEVCGEVLDYGPETRRRIPVGARVTSTSIIPHAQGLAVMGHDNLYPGGFGEFMLLAESQVRAVPDGMPTGVAALCEPLSVGFQYQRAANPQADEAPLVIGCGAIGLGLIAALRCAGVRPIVASDPAPQRREQALRAGADLALDPAHTPPFEAWKKINRTRKNPRALVFECVGVPGILNQLFAAAPNASRIVMAGFCMEPDPLFLAGAHSKSINLQLGGSPRPEDFDAALRSLDAGEVDVEPWITGRAPLTDALRAFEDAQDPTRHTRMLIEPAGVADAPRPAF